MEKITVNRLWHFLGSDDDARAAKVKEISSHFYKYVFDDADPSHDGFRLQFLHGTSEEDRKTSLDLAIHNQQTFFVQKFGGPEFYGGMVKESSFILDMHKTVFHCPPEYLDLWLVHFKAALDEVDFGARSAEIREILMTWSAGFGKAMINARNGELPKKPFGLNQAAPQ